MSYLKRTGTGINDVQWDENIIINDKNSDYTTTLSLKKNGTVAELDLKGSGTGVSSTNVIVRGIGQPSTDTDAVNKKYVDTTVNTAVPAGKFIETTGGTMTGELVLSGKPTQDNGAANKKYVDDAISGAAPAGDYVNKSGDTMTGNLNMSDNQITNVNTMTATNFIVKGTSDASVSIKVTGDASRSELDLNDASNNPIVLKGVDTPADNNDAANKQYVDAVDTKVTNLQGEVDGVKNTVTNITNGSTELPYLPIAGGTLTGALTLSGDPTADLQAVTKAYVDNKANDHEVIETVKGFDSMVVSCFKHNKFIFAFMYYALEEKYPVGKTNILLCTFNTSLNLLNIDFNAMNLAQGFASNGTSLGNVPVEVGYSLHDNKLYIKHLLVPSQYNVATVSENGSVSQMFAVEG